ncbi:MAG: hypothetical protein WA192_19760 [Candidatus Acidiferrales bacterium]
MRALQGSWFAACAFRHGNSITLALTWKANQSNFISMRLAKSILMAFIALALALYAFDCSAMASPAEAMQCCNTMPCSSHGHSQDCCKTMPAMHAPFVKSSAVRVASIPFALLSVLSENGDRASKISSAYAVVAHSHAPPILDLSDLTPLRI